MAKSKKEKEGFFVKSFKESWNFIASSRKYIYFAIFIFLAFVFIGLVFPAPDVVSNSIKELVKKLSENLSDLSLTQLLGYIFWNNFIVSIISICSGIFLGVGPFIIALSNGYVLGFIVRQIVGKLGFVEGVSSLWRLVPHGIFELPAVMISLGIGFRIGVGLVSAINKNSFKEFFRTLVLSLKVLVFFIIPLLVIAAIIEGILIKVLV